MRVMILALSVLGIVLSADAAKAGLSTTNRDLSASVDPATFTNEATRETEDQIGLDRGKRRDVQRGLTGIGFDTKVNGRFDELDPRRDHPLAGGGGHPKTGFLNTLQHKALQGEVVSATPASSAAAKNPMTTIWPVAVTGAAPAITAALAVQVASWAAWWADCSDAGEPTNFAER